MSYADEMIDDYLDRLLDAGDEKMVSRRTKRRRNRKSKRPMQKEFVLQNKISRKAFISLIEEVKEDGETPLEG